MSKDEVVYTGNPADIPWPADETGFLGQTRNELMLAASRVNGHPEKFEVFMQTLRVAAGHAKARFESQKRAIEDQLAALVVHNAEIDAAAEVAKQAYIATLEARVTELKAE